MIKRPKLSVAVPTHQFENNYLFFKRLLESLWNQTFQDFEIVVTDNSANTDIERLCDWYKTGIRYFKNSRKGMAQNTNEAIKRSEGEIIKILYMDDFLAHDNALERIVRAFTGNWLVTACRHTVDGEDFFNTHDPYYSDDIKTGNNTIGSPSVLTIKNEDPLLFDEEMTWLLDCDYFARMYEKFGEPTILKDVNVIIGLHPDQLTHTMGDERKVKEHEYMKNKYGL